MKRKGELHRLLHEFIERNFDESEILEICKVIKNYREAYTSFKSSLTPESTALARWALDDANRDWTECQKFYGLQEYKITDLINGL